MRRLVPGTSLFAATQPGKLCVQHGDGFGSRLRKCRARRRDFRLGRQQGAAGSLVAPVGSSATCSYQAQLQRGFVKQDVRVYRRNAGLAVPNTGLPFVVRCCGIGRFFRSIEDAGVGLAGDPAGGMRCDVAA